MFNNTMWVFYAIDGAQLILLQQVILSYYPEFDLEIISNWKIDDACLKFIGADIDTTGLLCEWSWHKLYFSWCIFPIRTMLLQRYRSYVC